MRWTQRCTRSMPPLSTRAFVGVSTGHRFVLLIAIRLHTLLILRGAIPAFIHISDGKRRTT